MDFDWTPQAEEFRTEVRAFLAEHLPEEVSERLHETGESHDPDFVRALGARNWISPDWERDGFQPVGHEEVHILEEELTRAEAPTYASMTGMMVCRVIEAVGSDWLREQIVPKALAGEITIALGMSEPEAGSDVAAVQTKARPIDDGWLVDGQKMFTTNGHVADYVFLLARTDPESTRHHGLTTFVVPLDLEGIEAQAVHTVSGERTNITFYSDVVVDDRWRISEVGHGWKSLMLALQDEHSAPFHPNLTRMLEHTEAWARTPRADGSRPLDEERVRRRLARAATEVEVADLLAARTSWMESIGDTPVAEGPMCKLFGTEALVRAAEDLTAMVGPDALRSRGDATAIEGGQIEHALRFSLGTTIYAGTSEIQRNIIAQHRCGLPRG